MRLLSRLGLAGLAGAVVLAVAPPAHAAAPVRHTAATAGQDQGVCAQDRRFLRGAHQSNLAEISGGYVALLRSERSDVRGIARTLITDHTTLDRDVRATARGHGVALPITPSARQIADLLTVATQPGNRFDRAWLRLQEASHVQTLNLIDAEQRNGCAADVQQVAATARPVVAMHLQMVRDALATD